MPRYELTINSRRMSLEADEDMPLLWALRDLLGLTGTKYGCGMALCGACTVMVDGEALRSCVVPVAQLAGKAITTIEGLEKEPGVTVQKAWQELSVPQCGYCQSGQIMSATALLSKKPKPSESDIEAAMNGVLCRCGTYGDIKKAIRLASERLS